MRKLVIFLAVVVMALTLMGGLALAGGYTPVNYAATDARDGSGGDSNDAIWNPNTAPASPHGGFATTTNQCRVCHAVHGAEATSWRLLYGATNAATECDGCHGAGGQTDIEPYQSVTDVQGEHSIGSTVIPDAGTTSLPGGTLTCNSCHSVHGANTLGSSYPAGAWNTRILRLNPQSGGTGGSLAASVVGAPAGTTDNELKTRFCSDCHDDNPNWDTSADTVDTRTANKTSHVQGPAAGGTVNVTGQGNTTVAWGATSASTGCTGCHSATLGGNSGNTLESAFPHQSLGSKLLADAYGQGAADNALGIDDAERVVPDMDAVCGSCHTQNGDFTGDGVGVTF